MDARFAMALASVLAVTALAGCTGTFDVNQTEPIRVQVEGAPQTVVVRESDAGPQKVVVQTCKDKDPCDTDQIELKLTIHQVGSGACKVHVTVEDDDHNKLEERDVDVTEGGNATETTTTTTTTSTSSGNGTTNGTANTTATTTTSGGGTTSSQVIVQTFVINVKGKDNVVVLTQALQGSAQVQVDASEATANGNGVIGNETSGSMSSSGTTSVSTTNSTSSSGTSSGPY